MLEFRVIELGLGSRSGPGLETGHEMSGKPCLPTKRQEGYMFYPTFVFFFHLPV